MEYNKRYIVRFQSKRGDNYRILIYGHTEAEVLQTVVLTPAAQPFVTSEDDSEDPFTPIRHQTGYIRIINNINAQNMMEKLMPANNISTPVIVYRVNGTQDTLVWQGFLSCESYEQNWTNQPEELELAILSPLAAMDSVMIDTTTLSGLQKVRNVIHKCLSKIFTDADCPEEFGYSNIYFSGNTFRFHFTKYIDCSALFEEKQQDNENSTYYEVVGLSCREILSRIATFMGWCIRENAGSIFITRFGETIGIEQMTFSAYGGSSTTIYENVLTNYDMPTNLVIRGNDHTRSITQGAKSVEIVASLEDRSMDMELPAMKYSDMVVNPEERWTDFGEAHIDKNLSAYNIIHNQQIKANWVVPNSLSDGTQFNLVSVSQTSEYHERMLFWEVNDFYTYYYELFLDHSKYGTCDWYMESIFAAIRNSENKIDEGMLIYGAPCALRYADRQFRPISKFALTENNYLFKQDCLVHLIANIGSKITFNMEIGRFLFLHYNAILSTSIYYPTLKVAIKFAGKWASVDSTTMEGSWVDNFTTIELKFKSDGKIVFPTPEEGEDAMSEITFPVEEMMMGTVSFYIYHEMTGWGFYNYPQSLLPQWDPIIAMLVKTFEIKYEEPEVELTAKKSNNHYYRLLGTNFSDEVQVATEFASNLNNLPSPSIIQNDTTGTNPMSTYEYYLGNMQVEQRRPEKDLLDQLAAFYQQVRRRIKLTIQPLADNIRTVLPKYVFRHGTLAYIPVAEERDWEDDTVQLTCIEAITAPNDTNLQS